MGCAFNKGTVDNNASNGANVKGTTNVQNQTDSGGQSAVSGAAPVDPRLPLNVRQKFNISKSWKGIARAMEPTGINMFVKLFEENAEILKLFKSFQQLKTRDQLVESMELAEHATIVMTSLDEAINSLENVDYFIEYLHSIGKLHHKVPGFKTEYFWKIERPFLAAVKDTLDDRYTENMENIYKIVIKFILETVVEGYEKGRDGGDGGDGGDAPDKTASNVGAAESQS